MSAERDQRNSSGGWRRLQAGLLAALAVMGVLGVADRLPDTRSDVRDAGNESPRRAMLIDGCAHEPELPPLLEVLQDTQDPELWQVRVLPGVEGLAQVTLETAQTAQWSTGNAPRILRLTRDSEPQSYAVRVVRSDKNAASGVRVGLTVRDDQGRIKLTVHRDLDSAPAAKAGVAVSREVPGVSAHGEAVLARVPADAPAPVQTEGAR